jgi:formylglycine-generating enzyme
MSTEPDCADHLKISLSEPWVVHHLPDGLIHGMPKMHGLADGTLLYYYHIVGDYASGSGGGDRRCLRSRDGGQTWEPEPVRLPSPLDLRSFPDGSVLEFEVAPTKLEAGVFDLPICRSRDGGHAWEEPAASRFFLPGCEEMVAAPLPTVNLPDGEVLGLLYCWSILPDGQRSRHRIACVVTQNMGRTWHLRSTIEATDAVQTGGFAEPAMVRLADGSLLAVMRSEAYESHWQSRSLDAGHTWSEPQRITGWGCFPRLSLLANGVLACSSGRPGFFMQFSLDGRGEQWTHHTEVAMGLGSWNCWYWEVAPGEILCTYDKLTRKQHADDPGACTWYMRRLSLQRVRGPSKRMVARDGKEMVYVPPGMFHYGADYHQVCTGGYYIDKHPVTVAEYRRFLQETGHAPPLLNHSLSIDELNPNLPINAVTWHDAQAYARWAGKRLPSDAEWEKAARGLNGRIYPWGDVFEQDRCCCIGSSRRRSDPAAGGNRAEVGEYSPVGDSPFGAAEMVGTSGEWTASDDPHWPGRKIWKGGAANLGPEKNRCSWYRSEHPENRHTIGIRCVLDA